MYIPGVSQNHILSISNQDVVLNTLILGYVHETHVKKASTNTGDLSKYSYK